MSFTYTLSKVLWLSVLLCQIWISHAARVKPEKNDDENCQILEKKRMCSLQTVNGTVSAVRNYQYPKKFILLWPLPSGPYEHARRVCEACDLEVAEIWDEDDHEQMVDLIKSKYSMDKADKKFTNSTFWLGATSPRFSSPMNYQWTYQDGLTSVRFHYLRLPESWPAGKPEESTTGRNQDCLAIGPSRKDPSRIVWKVRSCDKTMNYAVCQFKRKYHCYDESEPKPMTQLNPNIINSTVVNSTKKSGVDKTEQLQKTEPYYISNYPLNWELAKETCESENKSLLFLQTEEEHQHFRKIFMDYIADKPQHFHRGFWIAGKFHGATEYEKLSWWIQDERIEIENWKEKNSGGISKTWGYDPYIGAKTQEPYDASDNTTTENCVYVQFFYGKKMSTAWYTTDCEKSPKFFICRDDNVEPDQKSSVEYCEKKKYMKKEMQDCKWNLILKKQKPDCVCTKGVHGLTDHQNCNSRLLVGERCVKLYSKGVLHWKILSQNIVSEKSWLIAQSRNKKSGKFIEWFNMKLNSTRQLLGYANVYYSGLTPKQVGQRRYCFETSPGTENAEEFYEIKIRNETSILNIADTCPEGTLVRAKRHKVGTPATNECEMKGCKSPTTISDKANPFVKKCGDGKGSSGEDCEFKLILKQRDAKTTTPRPDYIAPPEVGSMNINVNQQMLTYAIDTAFMNMTGVMDISSMMPVNSWKILTKLVDIVKDVCACMVPPAFLDKALEMFKIAHYGQAYEYSEFFTGSEETEIMKMLSECKLTTKTTKAIECERNDCNNRVKKVMFTKNNGADDAYRLIDDTGYQGVEHHHVIEAVWNVIGVWNVACIKEFRQSYLLYHHLEQGMENLFTEEIKKLWHFPNVDENLYKKLLGPMEATYLKNLQHCVTGAYASNPKVMRLSRPKMSSTQLLGKRIRQRKLKEYEIATGYSDLDNTVVDNSDEKLKSKKPVKDTSTPIFCSRDQYCLKW